MQDIETSSNLHSHKDNFFKRLEKLDSKIYDTDLNEFKNEILKSFHNIEENISSRQEKLKTEMSEKLKHYDKQFLDYSIKLNEINSTLLADKLKVEKINDLVIFQKKANDHLISNEVKLNGLQKDLTNACYKYDRIYMDNLVVPGTIGDFCKFRNMKEYIENNISQVSVLNTIKEKHSMELKSHKERLDHIIKQTAAQIESVEHNIKNYTGKLLQKTEEEYKKEISDVCNRISDLRMDNHRHSANLQKAASDLSVEYDKIINIKSEVYKKLDESVIQMKNSNSQTVNSFESIKFEYEKIKTKFVELGEFIKDVRFRRNLGVDITRQELKKIANKVSIDRKRSLQTRNCGNFNSHDIYRSVEPINSSRIEKDNNSDMESYVKKYVHGGKNQNSESNKANLQATTDIEDLEAEINEEMNYDLLNDENNNHNVILELTEENFNNMENNNKFEMLVDNNEKNPDDINNIKGLCTLVKNIDINLEDESTLNNQHSNLNKSESELTDLKSLRSSTKLKTPQKKFKDKFPNKNILNNNIISENDIISSPNINNELLKNKTELINLKDEQVAKIKLSGSNNCNTNLKTEGNFGKQILLTVNENLNKFKNEISKKFAYSEKKLLEMEHYSKKKLEELASQIKIHIPINFNAYLKNYETIKSQQIIATNSQENEKIMEKNYPVNIIEPAFKIKETSGCGSNINLLYLNSTNQNMFCNNKKVISKVRKLSRKPSIGLKNLDITKTNAEKSLSKEKKNLLNPINSNDDKEEISKIENIKLFKKDEKNKNILPSSCHPQDKLYKTNYIPLSSVLTNNPSQRDDNINKDMPNYLKPLKNHCLDQFEFLENKHQLIAKLHTNKLFKD